MCSILTSLPLYENISYRNGFPLMVINHEQHQSLQNTVKET